MGREQTRQRLIEAAATLFYEQGIHRSGIEQILECAGLSKPTLYKHFRSKDELIEAVIERWRLDREADLTTIAEDESRAAQARITAVFRYYERWFREDRFRGCGLVNAAAELQGPGTPRDIIQRHKQWVVELLTKLARRAGLRAPRSLARQLAMLLEGATVMAHAAGKSDSGAVARRTAESLIESHRR